MEVQSLGAMLRLSCRKYADRVAMLTSGRDGNHSLTYAVLYEQVFTYAQALSALGVEKGDRLAILSENCMEWALVDWACQTLGIVVVPIYPTLPADQASYIVQDSGAKIAVVGDDAQAAKLAGIPNLQIVRLTGAEAIATLAGEPGKLERSEWESITDSIPSSDVATIIYTSGTTGLPKGAMLAHRGFLSLFKVIPHQMPVDQSDRFLCFLPMSHVFERTDGQYLPISLGASIAYAKNLASLAKDIVAYQPTLMLVVPRFLEATRDKILDGLKKQKPIEQKLFNLALAQGTQHFHGKFAPLYWLTNRIVGNKVRAKLGGKLRFFVAGGAALPGHVAEFYGAFGLPILQGYGLTETYSGVCVNHPDRNRYDTVGELLEGVEVKIAEDGEILFRGDACMLGYWNLPEETAKAIDEDGWFHTGDIGEFSGKYLKITDRKKDLLVLGNGKNVAPQPIENKLRSSNFIQEAVVLGDGMDHCIALIVPNFPAVEEALGQKEIPDPSHNPEVISLIRKEIDQVNKTLAGYEIIKKHAILEKPFSIESGELTPTLKVKRKVVLERYKDQIATLTR